MLKRIFDAFVIIVQVTFLLSFVKVVTIDIIPFGYRINLLLFMVIVNLIRFKNISIKIPSILKSSSIFYIYCLIFIFDVIQGAVFSDLGLAFARLMTFIDVLLFISYISKISNDKDSLLHNYLKVYDIYGLYNVAAVLLCAILISLGVLSATDNPVGYNSLTYDNIENNSTEYFFPGFLSIVNSSVRSLAVTGLPTFCGLSHEPHVLCFLVLPSFFFIQRKKMSVVLKTCIYVAYSMILLFTISTTAIAIFLSLIFIEIIWNTIISRKYGMALIIIIFISFIFYVGRDFISLLLDEMIRKVTTETGSLEYSQAMLEYIISPHGILGNGNIVTGELTQILNNDVGFLTCILDLSFYIVFVVKTIKLVMSKDKGQHYIGLGLAYFAIHLLKVNILAFSYPYLAFMVFLLCLSSSSTKTSHEKVLVN